MLSAPLSTQIFAFDADNKTLKNRIEILKSDVC